MKLTYLALGDSYTIGEQVLLTDSFPYQTVQILRETYHVTAPEIIAKTGWTSGELSENLSEYRFLGSYDMVSLLIGVNNQYRGLEASVFFEEFELLLRKAIAFAGGNEGRVFVLSIPDWGTTPYAKGRDTMQLTKEIDEYNEICKTIAEKYGCIFLDNTLSQRTDSGAIGMLADDGLHPSAKEYEKWALQLSAAMTTALRSSENGQ